MSNAPWEKKETEKKEEEKPVQSGEPTTNVLVSDLDAFVLDRMKSQPKSLDEIDVQVVTQRKEGEHRLRLPEELEAYKKKYAFCWIFKRKQAIDEACDLYHWVLCNRAYFPEVAKKAPHLFTARGAIERGDNILAFRTHAVDEVMRKAPGIESTERLKNRFKAHEGDATYYTPEDEYEKTPDGKLRKIPVVGV